MTGEAAVLFETEDECKKAYKEKQGQNIGHRWIELFQLTYREFSDFETEQTSRKFVRLANYITEANASRVVKLRGLPFNVTQGAIE